MTARNLGPTEAKRLQRDWRRRTERPLALLLDDVQTPFNVGAILRTAASFRVSHVWLAGASATPEHDKTRKTSLGTERLVPWSAVADASAAAAMARAEGLLLVGVELADAAVPLAELAFPAGGTCLVLGHEDRGLSRSSLSLCDAFAYVPTPGKVGSLNVATAAAIALYEARRQEWGAPTARPTDPPRSETKGVDLDP